MIPFDEPKNMSHLSSSDIINDMNDDYSQSRKRHAVNIAQQMNVRLRSNDSSHGRQRQQLIGKISNNTVQKTISKA